MYIFFDRRSIEKSISAFMLEFFGKSCTTPLTVKFILSSAEIAFPIASSLPKYLLAVLSVITIELYAGKGFALLPLTILKSKTEKKDGSIKKVLGSVNVLLSYLNKP